MNDTIPSLEDTKRSSPTRQASVSKKLFCYCINYALFICLMSLRSYNIYVLFDYLAINPFSIDYNWVTSGYISELEFWTNSNKLSGDVRVTAVENSNSNSKSF